MSKLITDTVVSLRIPIAARLSDLFQPEEQIAVEWISPEDGRVSLFSGMYQYEIGESETFLVRGKPGFCAAAIAELYRCGRVIDKRPQNSSVKFWIHLSGRRG